MAKTYKWSDLITDVGKYVKNIPTTSIDAVTCDKVSAAIWKSYPWRDSKTTIAPQSISLVDGQQDYSVPTNIYRLLKVSIVRTDTTPNEHRDLDVMGDLPVDLVVRSPYATRAISLQAGIGQLRLDSAVQIASTVAWDIRGEYQLNHTKVSSTAQTMWFDDMHINVAEAGILYYYYLLSDDANKSAAQFQLFKTAIMEMAASEDMGGEQCLFPDSPMGAKDAGGLYIFGS